MNKIEYTSFMHAPNSEETSIIAEGISELYRQNKVRIKECMAAILSLMMAFMLPIAGLFVANIITGKTFENEKIPLIIISAGIIIPFFCAIFSVRTYKRENEDIDNLANNHQVVDANARKCEVLGAGVMVTTYPIVDTDHIAMFHTGFDLVERSWDRKCLIAANDNGKLYAFAKMSDESVVAGEWTSIFTVNSSGWEGHERTKQ